MGCPSTHATQPDRLSSIWLSVDTTPETHLRPRSTSKHPVHIESTVVTGDPFGEQTRAATQPPPHVRELSRRAHSLAVDLLRPRHNVAVAGSVADAPDLRQQRKRRCFRSSQLHRVLLTSCPIIGTRFIRANQSRSVPRALKTTPRFRPRYVAAPQPREIASPGSVRAIPVPLDSVSTMTRESAACSRSRRS